MVIETRRTILLGNSTLLLLLGELAGVKSELLTLKDVAVGAANLSWARCDASEKTTSLEGGLEGGVELAGLLTDEDGVGELRLGGRGVGGLLLALSECNSVVLLVELLERSSIDLDDGALDEGVGTHQLVGDGVV